MTTNYKDNKTIEYKDSDRFWVSLSRLTLVR